MTMSVADVLEILWRRPEHGSNVTERSELRTGLRTKILPWMLGPVPLHSRCRLAAHVTGREGDTDGSCPVSARQVPDLGRVPPGAVRR